MPPPGGQKYIGKGISSHGIVGLSSISKNYSDAGHYGPGTGVVYWIKNEAQGGSGHKNVLTGANTHPVAVRTGTGTTRVAALRAKFEMHDVSLDD
jgi:hypothetical protein